MQFQVPQFIETEDHIVGPLTLRQFMYIGVAFGLSIMLYFAVATWLWAFLSIFILGLGGGLSFIKINGQELTKIIAAAIQFYWVPQIYVWQSDQPRFQKSADSLKPDAARATSIESIVGGIALKSAWRQIQTAGKPGPTKKENPFGLTDERYQISREPRGDRQAARRIDYR